MFFDTDIKGDRLPRKTLCLTYDDGPGETAGTGFGPRTSEISHYLFSQGIAATFFVVGKLIAGRDHILRQLCDQGHLIANHTNSHTDLTRGLADAGQLVDDVVRGHERIRAHVDGHTVFFRPPYGAWRAKGATASRVAAALNQSRRLDSHVGPVMWDIGGWDWAFWRDGRPPEDCTRDYLDQVERAGRGILLMHDGFADDDAGVRARNRTFELTTQLVPLLKQRGYRFVRLDSVPQVASAAAVSSQVVLQTRAGLVVSAEGNRGDPVVLRSPPAGPAEHLGLVLLGGERVALRAAGGQYMSSPPDAGFVSASAPAVGEWETLVMERVEDDLIALRTSAGIRLSGDGRVGGLLHAQARSNHRDSLLRVIRVH
jgi:peptidoglycan/xylan/chitin deacetylase (PgdA/CDA1 family)